MAPPVVPPRRRRRHRRESSAEERRESRPWRNSRRFKGAASKQTRSRGGARRQAGAARRRLENGDETAPFAARNVQGDAIRRSRRLAGLLALLSRLSPRHSFENAEKIEARGGGWFGEALGVAAHRGTRRGANRRLERGRDGLRVDGRLAGPLGKVAGVAHVLSEHAADALGEGGGLGPQRRAPSAWRPGESAAPGARRTGLRARVELEERQDAELSRECKPCSSCA